MTVIDKINQIDVPKYYIPCIIPLIVKELQSRNVPIYMNLIANSGLTALPNYKVTDSGDISSNVQYSMNLHYPVINDELGIKKNYSNFINLDDGLMYIRRQILKGKSVNVGVSTYFLPYSKDYRNEEYLNSYSSRTIGTTNHYIAIVDISEDKVRVLDTTPILRTEWLSIEDFSNSWRGDSGILDLQSIPDILNLKPYTYFTIELKKEINEEILIKTSYTLFRNILTEYLKGSIIKEKDFKIYFGYVANKKIVNDLEYLVDERDDLRISQFNQCLIEAKISRYFLRDIFNDICIIFPKYAIFEKELNSLLNKLEVLFTRINIDISKEKIKKDDLVKKIGLLSDSMIKEKILLEKIFDMT